MKPDSSDASTDRNQPSDLQRLLNSRLTRYIVTVTVVGLACLIRFTFASVFGSRFPYITFLPAVMVAALWCGFGPGLLATGMSALFVGIWILPPVGQFAISDTGDAIGLALFGCIGVFMSVVAGLYHQAREKLAAYEQEQTGQASRQPAATTPGMLHSSEGLLSFKKRMVFDTVLALILAILVSAGLLAYRDMTVATEADRWATHTYVVLDELDHLLYSLKDAEAGQRGFIITGDRRYLEPYQASLNAVEGHLVALRRLTGDNPRQQKRLATATPLVAKKLAELEETIALRETKGMQAASEAVKEHLAKNFMDELHALVGQAHREEEQLLQERTAEKEAGTSQTIRSVLLGGTLGGLALLLLFVSLKFELARRYRAEAELRAHQNRLTELVDERTRELRREQEALHASEARLDFALQTIHTGAWELDLVDHSAHRTLMHDRIFGYKTLLPEWTYEMFLEHVLPEDRSNVDKYFREATATQSDWNFECRIRRADGEVRWISSAGRQTLNPEGKPVRMAGVVQDITELKRAEAEIRQLNVALEERVTHRTAELKEANRELEAFCYSIAHDLRAPLRSIDGFSQAVLQDYGPKLDAEGQGYLEYVRKGCQQMGHLIEDLLKLSRVTRTPMQRDPVNFSELAQGIAGELQRLAPGRVVDFRIADGLTTKGDPHLLEAALRNLIENAWKFTAQRTEAVIEIGVQEKQGGTDPHSAPAFFVRDNGVGFDMAYSDKLFAPFQRLHKKEEFPGTGIGLATVQRILHRHGGRIWVEAAVDRGATFYFTLNEKGQSV